MEIEQRDPCMPADGSVLMCEQAMYGRKETMQLFHGVEERIFSCHGHTSEGGKRLHDDRGLTRISQGEEEDADDPLRDGEASKRVVVPPAEQLAEVLAGKMAERGRRRRFGGQELEEEVVNVSCPLLDLLAPCMLLLQPASILQRGGGLHGDATAEAEERASSIDLQVGDAREPRGFKEDGASVGREDKLVHNVMRADICDRCTGRGGEVGRGELVAMQRVYDASQDLPVLPDENGAGVFRPAHHPEDLDSDLLHLHVLHQQHLGQ
mmetsp:Transcript_16311/g.54626  ORF Transcript_16311/g.54626 Transcript_16311/m.54626 type:complete len:266 (-) Transcript_16311:955-1752(-)